MPKPARSKALVVEIQVLFFGATAEIVGSRRTEMIIDDDLRPDAFLKQIVERFPELAAHKLNLSINQQYPIGNEVIRGGDEVAIFTAVSGG